MKKIFKIVVIFILIIGCTGKSKSDMNTIEVKGSIEGLRKGTLYLQKIQDSVLIDLDSLVLKGSSDFRDRKSVV